MHSQTGNGEPRPRRITLTPGKIILLLTVNLIILMILAWPILRARIEMPAWIPWYTAEPNEKSSPAPSVTVSASPTATLPAATPSSPTATAPTSTTQTGFLILSMREGLDTHLFAYCPLTAAQSPLRLTRLTSGSWHDITPALSPDNARLAFASNRNGAWHIYIWNIESGEIEQLTDAPGYKASPTWSPDGLWIAYEQYTNDNLEIYIQQTNADADPIQLTHNRAADYAPAWSPAGREIAFVSTRGGQEQIWLADLDKSGDDSFSPLPINEETLARHPSWSPDGRYLAWASVMENGLHKIHTWDSTEASKSPRECGSGDNPTWNQNNILYTTVSTPYQSYLTAYAIEENNPLTLPLIAMPGPVESLLWVDASVYNLLPDVQLPTPTPLWNPNAYLNPDVPGNRWGLVDLQNVEAPYPQLHDRVDESFEAMRTKLAQQIGWDALSNLENAYVPLTLALSPQMQKDWLYTGRAITINPLPINAGWMVVIREDFGPETYWRIYLRARFQDGSQGRPLHTLPWDFNARYQAELRPYEQGGALTQSIPPGYWVDFTQLAATYTWERLPALSTWRSAYTTARFNEFTRSDDLDWETAMLEIYPPEVLITPTLIPTATQTPTITPTHTPTITLTPYPPGYSTPTPTVSATITPTPMQTVLP
ncbi:MAG: hypothetical protein U9Q82_00220 [Chloroflexota bacterium]|nr:hypothetical protein [Chloroflexota bacterium]